MENENNQLAGKQLATEKCKKVTGEVLGEQLANVLSQLIKALQDIEQGKIVAKVLEKYDGKTDYDEYAANARIQLKSEIGKITAEALNKLPKPKPVQRPEVQRPEVQKPKVQKPKVQQNSYAAIVARPVEPISTRLPEVVVANWADEVEEPVVQTTQAQVRVELVAKPVIEPLKKYWRIQPDIKKPISQKDLDNLVRSILKDLFESLNDYEEVYKYLDISVQLSGDDENYNISVVTCKFLAELSNMFYQIGIPYMDLKSFKLKLSDEVRKTLNDYVFDSYMETAYRNLDRILTVIVNHIIRGGSVKFAKNFDIEVYPFIKNLFVMN